MKRGAQLILVLALLAAMPAAGDFWRGKPYTRWSGKEIRHLIDRSPWTCEFRYVLSPEVIVDPEAGSLSADTYAVAIIRVHLFSSHPIRQAYVALIAGGDDHKLNRYRDFAMRDYADEIVVSWTLASDPPGLGVVAELDSLLRGWRLGDLQADTTLSTDTGKKVSLKNYIPPTPDGTGAKFVFPRFLPDGTPLLTDGDRVLRFRTRPISITVPRSGPATTYFIRSDERVPAKYDHFSKRNQAVQQRQLTVNVTFAAERLTYRGRLDF